MDGWIRSTVSMADKRAEISIENSDLVCADVNEELQVLISR